MTDNHAKFLSHLSDSNDAVWIVAQWLQRKGYPVTVHPVSKAKKHEDWKDHVDDGDLTVSMRLEVKHLSAEFTSKKTWPFRDKFIVCAKHSHDQSKQKPYAYIYLNSKKTHAAIVKGTTSGSWFVENKSDSRYKGVNQDFYLCPMELVRFVSLGKG